MANIKTGITLFSLGTLYVNRILTFEGVVEAAARMGAEGYEIVVAQSNPSYPFMSEDFLRQVENCKDKFGIAPACYAAQMDRGMLKDRDLTEDEMVARAITDVISANKLGCTVMREQYLLSPHGLERLAPYAELYNVHVGIEIHNPESPITPAMLDYLEVIEKTGSKHIGFIPDFGCFATGPNKPIYDRALSKGATMDQLDRVTQYKYDDVPLNEVLERMAGECEKTPALIDAINSSYGFVQFKKSIKDELEGLKRIMPYCFEMHGKFHYCSEDLHEPAIPYEEILPVIAETDFNGFVMTEYEDEGGYDAVEQCTRHIAMMNKILGK